MASEIITDRLISAHVNINGPMIDNRKLEVNISKLTVDSYEYILLAYVSMHCTI
jgi:hypothetical protein